MGLASWFRHSTNIQQIAAWAVEIARRCHAGVSQRLDQAMFSMSLPEARGYIRARAAVVVEQESMLVLQRTACQSAVAAEVRRRATEEVVRMAMGDLLKATRQSPAVRRAA